MSEANGLYKAQHALALLSSIGKLKADGLICDFTVVVETTRFDVHRAVVSACSEYFKAMLSHDMKESREGVVNMKEMPAYGVKACIDFMYHGEVTLEFNNVEGILHSAAFMQLDLLMTVCFDYLAKELTVKTVFWTKDIARAYGSDMLQKICDNFISQNFDAISKSEAFLLFSKSELLKYIVKPGVHKRSLWEALTRWTQHKAEERKQNMRELLEAFYTRNPSISFLLLSVWVDDTVQNSKLCRAFIVDKLLSDPEEVSENVTIRTCFALKEILRNVERSGADHLRGEANRCMVQHFEHISQAQEWVNLAKEDIVAIIGAANLTCSSEEVKWNSILKWTKQERDRKRHLYDLLKLLDFGAISLDFIRETMRKEPLVRESALCMGLIVDILAENAGRDENIAKPMTNNDADGIQRLSERVKTSVKVRNAATDLNPMRGNPSAVSKNLYRDTAVAGRNIDTERNLSDDVVRQQSIQIPAVGQDRVNASGTQTHPWFMHPRRHRHPPHPRIPPPHHFAHHHSPPHRFGHRPPHHAFRGRRGWRHVGHVGLFDPGHPGPRTGLTSPESLMNRTANSSTEGETMEDFEDDLNPEDFGYDYHYFE